MELQELIDTDKWAGVFSGHFSVTLQEQETYWSMIDDIEYQIACYLKSLNAKIEVEREKGKQAEKNTLKMVSNG